MKKNPHRVPDLNVSLLRRLLEAAEKLFPESFVRPSDEAVSNYLAGVATARERDEVQAALAGSAAFRKELLVMARERNEDRDDRKSASGRIREKLIIWQELIPQVPGGAVVRLSGVMPEPYSDEFDKTIERLISEGNVRIVLDLSGVSYMSTGGWSVIIRNLKQIREQGGDIKLAAMQIGVEGVFRALQMESIVHAYPSCSEAIASFQAASGKTKAH